MDGGWGGGGRSGEAKSGKYERGGRGTKRLVGGQISCHYVQAAARPASV